MSDSVGRPLKVFGECDPNNVWYEQWDNGTYFKGGNLYYLWKFKSLHIHKLLNHMTTKAYRKHMIVIHEGLSIFIDKNIGMSVTRIISFIRQLKILGTVVEV